ncbi:MAG TPA: glutaminyl-peptide cyclotransferase [Brevundimonas sp.]|jgi:glutamine cyclotransferase|uniref:glutaminyl-peptide cyclotransferase n=1 Tax=Brevundimonas sp. TaxID=1871086 RepID=UPI002BB3DB0C|nr:glutaminyl-peptide cyclotransferase [Brevundimonas sp.]HRH19793.1 glutaminyl-peptide cyclotransferase [Brevundimonas sp.]
MIRRFRPGALVVAVLLAGGCGSVAAQTPSSEPIVSAQPALPPHPPVDLFEVVNIYPHDPTAFTQGLIHVGGRMFESTGQFPSTVREVRLEDGEVLVRTELEPALFGEGLTELNGRLYSLTWQGGRGFIWNPDDLSAPVGEFRYAGEGWGLTTDGTSLILSDGTPVIRFLDPETFEVVRQMTVTFRGQEVRRLNELEWVDGQILANLWQQDLIARIDPATGEVVGVIDLTDLLPLNQGSRGRHDVLNGIAWDAEGRRLFVTGKHWPYLFEIRLVPAEAPPT